MANYQLLKADIDEKVYQNGHQEITGENLNAVLNAMVTTLGAEYQFAGVATTVTNQGTPDAKVFYIANGKGTYTNFGGLEVTEDEVVVLYYDTEWHKVATGVASQAKLTELETSTNKIIQDRKLDNGKSNEYVCDTTEFRYVVPLEKLESDIVVSINIKTKVNTSNSWSVNLYANVGGSFNELGKVFFDEKMKFTIPRNCTELRLAEGNFNIGDTFIIDILKVHDNLKNDEDIHPCEIAINNVESTLYGKQYEVQLNDLDTENEYYYSTSGEKLASPSHRTVFIDVMDADTFSAQSPGDSAIFNFFDENKNWIKNASDWVREVSNMTIPVGVRFIGVSVSSPKAYSVRLQLTCKNNVTEQLNEITETLTSLRTYKKTFYDTNPQRYLDLSRLFNSGDSFYYRVSCTANVNNLSVHVSGAGSSSTIFVLPENSLNTWYSYTYDGVKNNMSVWQDTATLENNISVTIEIKYKPKIDGYVNKADVVNNFDDGGADVPLSADKGKQLSDYASKYDAAYANIRTSDAKFIKSLHLDCGRKYFSPANIKLLIDNMQMAGLNMLQLYMWDVQGFRFALDDWNIVVNGVTYDLSTALGDHELLPDYPVDGNTNPTPWITESEMDDIISYANAKGIEIVPSFDMPGAHMASITNAFPTLAGLTGDGLEFKLKIIDKLCKYFKSRGSRFYNIGGDESGVDILQYANFMKYALRVITQNDLTPIIWNDEVCKNGLLEPYLNNGVIVMPWKQIQDNTIQAIKNGGYRIINSCHTTLYCSFISDFWDEQSETSSIVDARFNKLKQEGLSYFMDGSHTDDFFGVSMCIWNDSPELFGSAGWNGDKVIELSKPYIKIYGEVAQEYEKRARWQNYCKILEERIALLENSN